MTANKISSTELTRRQAIQAGLLGALGVGALINCGGGGGGSSSTTAATTTSVTSTGSTVVTSTGSTGSCALIPTETGGPYPLWDTIAQAAVYQRQDITENTQTGVPLTLTLTLVNVNNSCAVISGAMVYIWHCNKGGEYSGYSSTQNGSHSGETWLRGVQTTDSSGQVTFTTIYPGWYAGRVTHIHLRAYMGNDLEVTTQLAFTESITTAVYNTSLYSAHGQNTSVATNAADQVFSDGTTYQLLTLTGNTTSGYVGTLEIGIAL